MGALHDAVVAASTESQRKAVKAQAWADAALPQGYAIAYRGHTITLTTAIDASSGDALLTMTIVNGTTDITPPTLNPIRIVNPPYMVEDAAGDIELSYLDADGNPQTKMAREDVPARIIGQLQALADKVIDA